MDFRDWLAMLRRYWLSITAAAIVGALLGGVATLAADKAWTSSTQLMFTPAGTTHGDGQDLAYSGQYVATRMKTYERLATSASVVDDTVDALDRPAWASADDLAARWEPETALLTLEATAPSAEEARRYAEALAAALVDAVSRLEATGADRRGAPAVNATVVSAAQEPASPSSPRMSWNVLGGAVLGLLAGLVLALARRLTGPRST